MCDGSGQERPPNWRIWDGATKSWLPFDYYQDLAADAWHTLTPVGNIQGGLVHYQYFVSDSTTFTVNRPYSPTADTAIDKPAVAVQLDGGAVLHNQNLYLDGVGFR